MNFCFRVVCNSDAILSSSMPTVTRFTVMDLCFAFFSLPLDQASQHLFAFHQGGQQHPWAVTPQGCTEADRKSVV